MLLVALDMLRAQRSPVIETAAASEKDDVAITSLAGPAAISTVILMDAQAAGWAQRGILLACLAVLGLASYIILTLRTKGTKWLTPMAEKIMTRLMGLLLAALAVQFLFIGLKGEGGLLQQ